MARRRKARKSVRYITKKVGSYRRRKKGGYSKPESVILPSMLYGAVREKASIALAPVLSKVPLGDVADEVGMGIISYFVAKKGKGIVKEVGKAGLTIESARMGEALASGSMFGSTAGTSNVLYG